MHYLVYKITNLVNGKEYIGCHMTSDLGDRYLGSGKQIRDAVKKYGRQSFLRTIVQNCNNESEMFELERMLVTEDYVARTDTYNMKVGGFGGWSHCNADGIARKERSRRGALATNAKFISKSEKQTEAARAALKEFGHLANSDESKKKRIDTFAAIAHQTGNKNSQFGKCWITKDGSNLKIRKEELQSYEANGWTKGRYMGT